VGRDQGTVLEREPRERMRVKGRPASRPFPFVLERSERPLELEIGPKRGSDRGASQLGDFTYEHASSSLTEGPLLGYNPPVNL
jgi:hypothetical protein